MSPSGRQPRLRVRGVALLVLASGTLVAHLALPTLGAWTWLPVMLMYWLSLGCFIALAGGRTAYRRWLQPSSGGLVWRLLTCLTFALFLPTFLLNWSRLNESWLLAIWLGVALVDPWLEEGYWRGALREATATWPGWLCIGGRRLRVDEWLRSGAAVVCRRPC